MNKIPPLLFSPAAVVPHVHGGVDGRQHHGGALGGPPTRHPALHYRGLPHRRCYPASGLSCLVRAVHIVTTPARSRHRLTDPPILLGPRGLWAAWLSCFLLFHQAIIKSQWSSSAIPAGQEGGSPLSQCEPTDGQGGLAL